MAIINSIISGGGGDNYTAFGKNPKIIEEVNVTKTLKNWVDEGFVIPTSTSTSYYQSQVDTTFSINDEDCIAIYFFLAHNNWGSLTNVLRNIDFFGYGIVTSYVGNNPYTSVSSQTGYNGIVSPSNTIRNLLISLPFWSSQYNWYRKTATNTNNYGSSTSGSTNSFIVTSGSSILNYATTGLNAQINITSSHYSRSSNSITLPKSPIMGIRWDNNGVTNALYDYIEDTSYLTYYTKIITADKGSLFTTNYASLIQQLSYNALNI